MLISPVPIHLPAALLKEAERVVAAFFSLRNDAHRDSRLSSLAPAVAQAANCSALMSYDFHIDSAGVLRLIEINTNASMSLLVDAMAESLTEAENKTMGRHFRRDIIATFEAEYAACGLARPLKTIAIVDENPLQQRLHIEFELYGELFRQHGYQVSIEDPGDLKVEKDRLVGQLGPIDLVYNRDTDFYLEHDKAMALREAANRQLVCLTPHPHDYRLLADKERLLELSISDELESAAITNDERATIRRALIQTIDVDSMTSPDELWSARKKYFFKPRRSFGGKAVYRGSSTSRGTFEDILKGHYLAQENVPPPHVKWRSPSGEDLEFKYDLRFYAYRDRVQLASARLYRGQMTNSQTPFGGVTPVNWIS